MSCNNLAVNFLDLREPGTPLHDAVPPVMAKLVLVALTGVLQGALWLQDVMASGTLWMRAPVGIGTLWPISVLWNHVMPPRLVGRSHSILRLSGVC
jgi:hypothetical protein